MKEATLAQASHLLTLVNQKGVPAEQLQAVYESGLFADLLDANVSEINRDHFRKLLGLTPLELRFVVNYDMTLKKMIARGHYDWVGGDIRAEHLPSSGKKGRREIVAQLMHFNRFISSEVAFALLNEMGLRPATIEELLAFGATFPDLQKKFPILALGSPYWVDGRHCVACLSGGGPRRRLSFGSSDRSWNDFFRFLAVRKPA